MKYEVTYYETLRCKIIIEANSWEEAKNKLHDQYENGFDLSEYSTQSTLSEDLEIESGTEILSKNNG